MDDLEEKIQAVLNDPQQMQEIFSLARSLGLELPAEGGPPDGKAPEPPKDIRTRHHPRRRSRRPNARFRNDPGKNGKVSAPDALPRNARRQPLPKNSSAELQIQNRIFCIQIHKEACFSVSPIF